MTSTAVESATIPADRKPGWRRRLGLALAGLLLVACLVVVVWGQLWLRGQRADDDRKADVLAAAERGTSQILSYDYRRLAEGRRDTEGLLTGDALRQYQDVQAPLVKAAPRLKAVVTADVKVATVLSADERSARVLLFVDQISSSTKLTQPQLDQSRVVVGLTRRNGSWLIESISAV
jgi:Mce-associated membrane protein